MPTASPRKPAAAGRPPAARSVVTAGPTGRTRLFPADAPIDVVDLFCGCGGISAGLAAYSARDPVFRLAGGVDIDPDAADTYAANLGHAPVRDDIRRLVSGSDAWDGFVGRLDRRAGNPVAVFGGPPCQGFSSHRVSIAECGPLNSLLPDFARAAVRLDPAVVCMENVPELLTTRSWPVYAEFAAVLGRAGYVVRTRIYNFAGFGLPQERFRAVTIAMRTPFPMPEPFLARAEYRTVRSALSHLPEILPGVPDSGDPDHVTARHRESTVATIAAVAKDGGRRSAAAGPDCLRRLATRNGRTGYDDVYGRLAWDRPAVTITGHSRNPASGRFSHPEQNRGLSVREAALLQGFPPDYSFRGTLDSRFLQVGNAVSPLVAAVLAGHIAALLAGRPGGRCLGDTRRDITAPVGVSFSRLIPGIKMGAIQL